MNKKIGWGIVGLGNIAGKFAGDLALSSEAILVAVASRDSEKARLFSEEYGAKKAYGTYEALFEDPGG